MLSKIVDAAAGHYKGTLLQVGSMSAMVFGIEVGFETIFVFGGFLLSVSAFIIQLKSSRLQNKLNQKELEKADLENENIRFENEILKRNNPDLLDEDGNIKTSRKPTAAARNHRK
jgi:hypothetical protein